VQVSNFGTQSFNGGEVAEGEIDAGVVVVDGLGNMHDRHAFLAFGKPILEGLQLVGGFERIIAADGDQRINTQRSQAFVNSTQRG
jgi:hypothetical protein